MNTQRCLLSSSNKHALVNPLSSAAAAVSRQALVHTAPHHPRRLAAVAAGAVVASSSSCVHHHQQQQASWISSCYSLQQPQPQQQHHHHATSPQHRRSSSMCVCAASKGGNKSNKQPAKQQKQKQQPATDLTNNMDDMEDVIDIEDDDEFEFEEDGFVDFDADDDVISDEDAEFEEGDDDDLFGGLGSDDDPGPEVLTGNVEWGDKALQVAEAVLARPDNENLSLYLFRVLVPNKTIEIRLDKLDDPYGSPGLEDIERFSRALAQGIEAELGVDAAGEISFEVSSPGAERTLILPQDLLRFQELPMRVEYMTDVGIVQTLVLNFLELNEAEGNTVWELADVKANQNVKGRGLSKKQRMQKYDIKLESLERVRIYVDF